MIGELGMDFELVRPGTEVFCEELGDKAFEGFFRREKPGMVDSGDAVTV